MEKNLKKTLWNVALIIVIAFSTASKCNEEDDPQPKGGCEAFEGNLNSLYNQLDKIGYDCDKMPKLFDDILDLLQDQKDCVAAKQVAKDKGFDSVDAYITSLSKTFDAYLSDCPG